jgi:REP element-mobilizing transposase RayT
MCRLRIDVRRGVPNRRSRAYGDGVARRPRSFLPEYAFFHVTSRGTGGVPIFVDDVDRLRLRGLIHLLPPRFGIRCIVWCFMTTHYHGVFEGWRDDLSQMMQRLNGRYAQEFNERHDRRGHLFEARYSSWVVRDEEHLEATCAYVLANPVRAGICDSVDEWPWSWFASEDERCMTRPATTTQTS